MIVGGEGGIQLTKLHFLLQISSQAGVKESKFEEKC